MAAAGLPWRQNWGQDCGTIEDDWGQAFFKFLILKKEEKAECIFFLEICGVRRFSCACNRVLIPNKGEYPLSRGDKAFGFYLVRKSLNYYLIDAISMAWMGHHYHLVVHVSPTLPSLEEIAERHNRFYGKNCFHLDPALDPDLCLEVGRALKSTILAGREALWNCVKHVELNPVRAKITENVAHYRDSTWGERVAAPSVCGKFRLFYAA